MAIWAPKWPPDSRQDADTTAQIAAIKEKQLNAAYVEIELVDEPSRLVNVLLDLGASCSVFSKRSLQGIYHKLIRHPPRAKLVATNGGSLGMAEGISRLRFRFPGYSQIFEHNVEIVDNDGVPSIFGNDFWKTIGANVSLSDSDRGDTVSWITGDGTKVTLKVHCSSRDNDLTSATRLTVAVCMQPEGHKGESTIIDESSLK